MQDDLLAKLAAAVPDEIKAELFSQADEGGASAEESLEQALESPALLASAVDALGRTPTQESWQLLDMVAQQASSRKLRKSARRAQHRLRSRGFQPQELAHTRVPLPPPTQAWASLFDGSGAQLLRVVQDAPFGIQRYARFVISPKGLEASFSRVDNRTAVQEIIADEDEHLDDELVETTLAYVARRVQQAIDRSRELDEPLPEYYLDDIRILEGAPEDPWPEELESIPASEGPISPKEAQALLDHPHMRYWILPHQQVEPYAEDWLSNQGHVPFQTEQGLLNLSFLQARGRMRAEIIDDLCDEALCQRLVEQLREQARLFHNIGEKDPARSAVRCAREMETNASPDNVFLQGMVENSMDNALRSIEEQEQEIEDRSSPWVRRDEQGGALWVPQPDLDQEEQDPESGPQIWLPGQ